METKNKTTLAIIAYLCAENGFYSGDFYRDISTIIQLSEEFEKAHINTDFNNGEKDYLFLLEEFVESNKGEFE